MELYYRGNVLKENLTNTTNINKIKIAVAYFSEYGLKTLKDIIEKNRLSKNRVELYLSPEFTNKNQGNILKELNAIANVYIVFDIKFHPKVYLFECKDSNKLIFGSSNFTLNGIEKNIEFDSILDLEDNSLHKAKVDLFFTYCKENSKIVDDKIIDWYISIESELEELRKSQEKIRKKIFKIETSEDPFDEDRYNLDDYYFKYKDYETFFPRNVSKDEINIRESRIEVREKMLSIHKKIYKNIKELGIDCHWRKDNITSLIRPCQYNKGKVDWIGVRYGKQEWEIKTLNKGAIDGELGFQKHACIQYAIAANGFEINLFHSVPHDAVDRDELHRKLMNLEDRKKIENELRKLKGHGICWHIDDAKFYLDKDDISKFYDFYIYNDSEGKLSSLGKFFEPDDINLKDEESICNLVNEYVSLLIPLYNLVSFRLNSVI